MMTNDLAIKILLGDVLGTTEQTHEAVEMAVKALSALPSADVTDTNVGNNDLISREAAYEVLSVYYHHSTETQHNALREALNKVPSAERVAHWEKGRCSRCHAHAPFWMMASTYYLSNYCPNCGARMDGEHDG